MSDPTPDPVHAVVIEGTVSTLVLMAPEMAQLYRDYGLIPVVWGAGAVLVDVTGLDPRPWAGWQYDGAVFTPPVEDPPADEPAEPEPIPAS